MNPDLSFLISDFSAVANFVGVPLWETLLIKIYSDFPFRTLLPFQQPEHALSSSRLSFALLARVRRISCHRYLAWIFGATFAATHRKHVDILSGKRGAKTKSSR